MKQTRKHPELIYDVGMHKGEDTDYYLAKGYRVVGFEADPILAAHCRSRFSAEMGDGRVIVVEGAIVNRAMGEAPGKPVTFYRNTDMSVWGTVADQWARRCERLGTSIERIEVPVVNFSESLEQYGIPHYLKVDIEGMDTVCLRSLLSFAQRPDYVSIESDKVSLDRLLEELDLFACLGYTGFKAIQQKDVPHQAEPNPSPEGRYVGYRFPPGSSGLFGGDLPGEWKDREQIIHDYKKIFFQYELFGDDGKLVKYLAGKVLRKGLALVSGKAIPGWYDTHAKHSCSVS